MIKKWYLLLAAVLTICGSVLSAVSAAGNCQWYFRTGVGGVRPVIAPEFAFADNGRAIWLGQDPGDKVIYLTFDAGYENGNVAKILDVLKKHDAEGAFFILEQLAKAEPGLVRRMKDEGHLVCNHTATHPDVSQMKSAGALRKELCRLEDAVREVTGEDPDPFFRPPQGAFTADSLAYAAQCGYRTVLWSYAYADWDNARQPDPQKAIDRILDHTHNGMVLLLHPTSSTNAAILDRLLTEWEARGYRFGSLYEFC
ncbi:MAG: polysaccharide deacetylase family protein [Lachnospiraceae bacterium]|nr:polysaccharide deacetylase family protein [Lachnospiraceae bacterium]